jgi:hypothetical protein
LTNTIPSEPLGTFKAKLLHPFGTTATSYLSFGLLFCHLPAMLTPVFLLSLLPFLLETDDNVNRSTHMHIRARSFLDSGCDGSRSNIGDGRTSNIEVFEERIRGIWQRGGTLHAWTLSKTSHANPWGLGTGRRTTR